MYCITPTSDLTSCADASGHIPPPVPPLPHQPLPRESCASPAPAGGVEDMLQCCVSCGARASWPRWLSPAACAVRGVSAVMDQCGERAAIGGVLGKAAGADGQRLACIAVTCRATYVIRHIRHSPHTSFTTYVIRHIRHSPHTSYAVPHASGTGRVQPPTPPPRVTRLYANAVCGEKGKMPTRAAGAAAAWRQPLRSSATI